MNMEVQVWEVEVAHLRKDSLSWEKENNVDHLLQTKEWWIKIITHSRKERCHNLNQILEELVVVVVEAYLHHTNQTWNNK